MVAAERAETARLREELASRPAAADGEGEESDDASRRMYERISRELERERATVRHAAARARRQERETAEQRRSVAAAATNGVAHDDRRDPGRRDAGRPRRPRAPRP